MYKILIFYLLLNTYYSFFNLKNINIDDLLIFLVFYVILESCLEKKTNQFEYTNLGFWKPWWNLLFYFFIIFWHLIDN